MLCVIHLLLKIFWSKLNMKPLPSPHTNLQANLVHFGQMAFSYKTPHQYIEGLRSCLGWFWTPAWRTRGCFPFHSPGLPRQQTDETQLRARTTRATKPDPAELQFGMPLLEGIAFFRSCMAPGPNRSDQGLSSWEVETNIRLWWVEWAHDRPSR